MTPFAVVSSTGSSIFSILARSSAVNVLLSTMSMHDPVSIIHRRAGFSSDLEKIGPPVDRRALLMQRSPIARERKLAAQGSPPTRRPRSFDHWTPFSKASARAFSESSLGFPGFPLVLLRRAFLASPCSFVLIRILSTEYSCTVGLSENVTREREAPSQIITIAAGPPEPEAFGLRGWLRPRDFSRLGFPTLPESPDVFTWANWQASPFVHSPR